VAGGAGAAGGLSLPMRPFLTEWEQDRVISVIQAVVDDDFSSQPLNFRIFA